VTIKLFYLVTYLLTVFVDMRQCWA